MSQPMHKACLCLLGQVRHYKHILKHRDALRQFIFGLVWFPSHHSNHSFSPSPSPPGQKRPWLWSSFIGITLSKSSTLPFHDFSTKPAMWLRVILSWCKDIKGQCMGFWKGHLAVGMAGMRCLCGQYPQYPPPILLILLLWQSAKVYVMPTSAILIVTTKVKWCL